MRKIDPTTLDLSKLAVSDTGVPIGFRELLPEEYPSNGDIFDLLSYSEPRSLAFGEARFRRRDSIFVNSKSCKNYGDRKTHGWLKHYRVLEVPDAIPANYGKVADGKRAIGDIQVGLISGRIYPAVTEANELYYLAKLCYGFVDVYRLQPAFPQPQTKRTFQHCYAAHCAIKIPAGFRELNPKELRIYGQDLVWLPEWHDMGWKYSEGCTTPYGPDCNPSIRRIEPVSCSAPKLPVEPENPYVESIDSVVTFPPLIDRKIDRQTKQIRELQAKLTEVGSDKGLLIDQLASCREDLSCEVEVSIQRYNEIQNLRAQFDKVSSEARESAKAVVARANEIEELKTQLRKLGETKPDSVKGVGVGYRPLADHETPQIGDEFRYITRGIDGAWQTQGIESSGTISEVKRMSGWTANCTFEYRRKC